jgi:NTP pyrophosphatase (non-canonical NTP hydrolase)
VNTEKLTQWAKEIHDNATAHGWHEEKHSPEHWLSLIMCEVAEAIEADRKGKYYIATGPEPSSKDSKYYYQYWYENNVKGTVEEEFADIVIRLLDMGAELYEIEWANYDVLIRTFGGVYFKRDASFVENAWIFVRHQLGAVPYNVLKSIQFIYMWAEHLGIDLDQHIEWKMQYNKHRPYKHGGKKY